MKNKVGKILFGVLICLVFIALSLLLVKIYLYVRDNQEVNLESDDTEFTYRLIKESDKKIGKNNYMISPYSIEVALSMLREGASDKTLDELNNIVPERNIKDLSVKNKINIANSLFIKDDYKKDVIKDFSDTLTNKYNSNIIYDKFDSPDKINNWVKKETNGMIPSILDKIPNEFVLGLANAVAIDVEWENEFKCENTRKDEFTLLNGDKKNVSMMNTLFKSDAYYYENDVFEAVSIPYKKYNRFSGKESDEDNSEQLEFIGLLPKNSVDDVINSMSLSTMEEINKSKRYASEDDLRINVGLPKFSFKYNFSDFASTLKQLGIKRIFINDAEFKNMINTKVKIATSIHKTFIEVDEKGTKAAAVTYFGANKAAAVEPRYEIVDVKFNKPFVFMIKDSDTNEILFFGVVYEPSKWEENDC